MFYEKYMDILCFFRGVFAKFDQKDFDLSE